MSRNFTFTQVEWDALLWSLATADHRQRLGDVPRNFDMETRTLTLTAAQEANLRDIVGREMDIARAQAAVDSLTVIRSTLLETLALVE